MLGGFSFSKEGQEPVGPTSGQRCPRILGEQKSDSAVGKGAVEVLEDHQRWCVSGGLLEQRDQLAALVVAVTQIERVWPDVRMRCHHADHGSFPIAGVAVEQIAPVIREVVLPKPLLSLEE